MLSRPQSNTDLCSVKLINQFPIYELGGSLRVLKATCGRSGADAIDQLYSMWRASTSLREVLAGDQSLHFCRRAAEDLLDELERKTNAVQKTQDGQPVSFEAWELTGIRNKVDIFEHQLSAELAKTASYAVPTRGIFDVELLSENAERHIHETVRQHISDFAIVEFRNAGRCLAFGLYSASGFHSARAVENVVRTYYARFIGPPPDKPMGLLTSHLGDLLTKENAPLRPKENTIRHMRDVTNFDRNPLIHRGVELEEIDAMTLFNSALGVIVEMTKELAALDDSDLQEPLPLVEVENALSRKSLPVKKRSELTSRLKS
jgi:hypothetical protein